MVGYQHADALGGDLGHDALDVDDRQRVDARKWFVEEHKTGLGRERARYFDAPPLAAEPRFMLLDEPFAGVDPLSVLDIQRIIRELTSRGIGVLITDHNVRETLGVCSRAYIVNQGQVIASGSAEEILANPQVREVYLGQSFRM